MNFIRPLDLSLKTNISDDVSGVEESPVWCDSLLNVKAIISNHELLLDWGNEDISNTGPWRWRYERSPPFLSLKRKVSEIVNEEADEVRAEGDDERSGPSDDPDFFVFKCDSVSEVLVIQEGSAENENTNSSLSIKKKDPTNELKTCWSDDFYSPGDENFCWRFDSDSVESPTLEMLLEDLDLSNCLREVDPELEPVTECIEVSRYDEPDEEEDLTQITQGAGDPPDIEMFSSIMEGDAEDITSYENLLEDLSMSDDDEKDSGINEDNCDTLTLMEDESSCSINVLREKTIKDYSKVNEKTKSKCRSTAIAVNTKVVNPEEEFRNNGNKVSGAYNKSQDKIESDKIQENVQEAICNHLLDQTSKATLKEGINTQNLQENLALPSPRSPSRESPCRKKFKCDSDMAISVNETDIPDLSELLNRDSGLGDTPNDGLECFSDSDHDDLLIVCD